MEEILTNLIDKTINGFENDINDNLPIVRNIINKINKNGDKTWVPYIVHKETKNIILIQVELAGVKKEDIELNFSNDIINIKGIRKYHNFNKTDTVHKNEIITGKFTRKIKVSINITNPSSIKTNFTDGILSITIDKNNEKSNNFSLKV